MKRFQLSRLHLIVLGVLFSLTSTSYAQYSAIFQGAKSVGKGNGELTLQYSNIGFAMDGNSEKYFDNLGFLAGIGISELTEIRVRYDRLGYFSESMDYGLNTLWVGPKFSSQGGKFAFYLPVGFNFGDEVEKNWMLDPTLLFSLPLGGKVSLNLMPSYLFSLEEGSGLDEGLLKLTIGFGIHLGTDWIIRPEGGLQYYVSDFDGNLYNFGLGITRKLGK